MVANYFVLDVSLCSDCPKKMENDIHSMTVTQVYTCIPLLKDMHSQNNI